MEQDNSMLSPFWIERLTEKHQNLSADLQDCDRTLKQLKAGQGNGGSAEQIWRWETTKEIEHKQIELQSKLELLDELLNKGTAQA